MDRRSPELGQNRHLEVTLELCTPSDAFAFRLYLVHRRRQCDNGFEKNQNISAARAPAPCSADLASLHRNCEFDDLLKVHRNSRIYWFKLVFALLGECSVQHISFTQNTSLFAHRVGRCTHARKNVIYSRCCVSRRLTTGTCIRFGKIYSIGMNASKFPTQAVLMMIVCAASLHTFSHSHSLPPIELFV